MAISPRGLHPVILSSAPLPGIDYTTQHFNQRHNIGEIQPFACLLWSLVSQIGRKKNGLG